jgi:hypothetical protein
MIVVAMLGTCLGIGTWAVRLRPRHAMAEQEASLRAMETRLWSSLIRSGRAAGAPVSVTRFAITKAWRQPLADQGYDVTRPYSFNRYLSYNPWDALKYPKVPHFEELMVACRERLDYHERMRRKWAWYAWMPWVQFESDPPRPPVCEPEVSQSY